MVVRQLLEAHASLEGAAALAAPALGLPSVVAGEDRYSVLYGLYWLAANLAAEPLALVVPDDAQWADAPLSLGVLAHIAVRLEGLPVTMVLAFVAAGEPALDGLRQEASAAVDVRPLGAPSSAAVVVRSLVPGADDAGVVPCHAAHRR